MQHLRTKQSAQSRVTRERADVEAITRSVEEVKQELAQIKTEVKVKPPPRANKGSYPSLGKTAKPVNTQKKQQSYREPRRHPLPWHN